MPSNLGLERAPFFLLLHAFYKEPRTSYRKIEPPRRPTDGDRDPALPHNKELDHKSHKLGSSR